MGLIARLLLNALALVIVTLLFEGIWATGLIAILWAALILGIVNVTVKPLFKLLTFPVNIVTLGIFGLLVNALMLKVVDWFSPGFHVEGFFAAFFGAIVLSIVSSVLNLFAD